MSKYVQYAGKGGGCTYVCGGARGEEGRALKSENEGKRVRGRERWRKGKI